jgi:hypothetical protein
MALRLVVAAREVQTMRDRLARLVAAGMFLSVGAHSSAEVLTTYFVVAESGDAVHGDSYILPLEDPSDVAHARDLIVHGLDAGAPIVVAEIAKGADGVNRDYLAPGQPLWSWHVERFEGFADATIELIDGWPSFVEEDVNAWIANTGGHIGFWSYTVVAELAAVSEAQTVLLIGVALACLALIERGSRCRRVA